MDKCDNKRYDSMELYVRNLMRQYDMDAAVEKFLENDKVNDLIHEVFSTGCLEIAAAIDTMHESIRDAMKADLEGFEKGEALFTNDVLDNFRNRVCEIIKLTVLLRNAGDAWGFAMRFANNLRCCGDGALKVMRDVAQNLFDEGKGILMNSWLLNYIEGLEDNGSRIALMKLTLGDIVPDLENCTVVPIVASSMEEAMEKVHEFRMKQKQDSDK